MRKKDDTLHDTLLEFAHDIAETDGIDSINIRALAKKAGVATGTVYNYFSSKDDILLALTEDYWKKAFAEIQTAVSSDSFCVAIGEIYIFLKEHLDHSARKLMGGLKNTENIGRKRMASMHQSLEAYMIACIKRDIHTRPQLWNETFTEQAFAHFIMTNLIMVLQSDTSDISFLIEIIKRTIY